MILSNSKEVYNDLVNNVKSLCNDTDEQLHERIGLVCDELDRITFALDYAQRDAWKLSNHNQFSCPSCGGCGHNIDINNPNSYKNKCDKCGIPLSYPWEF